MLAVLAFSVDPELVEELSEEDPLSEELDDELLEDPSDEELDEPAPLEVDDERLSVL